MKRAYFSCVALVTILLCACVPPTNNVKFACSDIADKAFLTAPINSLRPETTSTWVAGTYRIAARDIKIVPFIDGATAFIWNKDSQSYTAYLGVDGRRYLQLTWRSRNPNVGDILRCFGDPLTYQAHYRLETDTYDFLFAMWYPKSGLVAAYQFQSTEIKPIHVVETTKITSVRLVPVGTLEEMLPSFYGFDHATENFTGERRSFRLWPSKLADITVDIAPDWLR